MSRKVQDEVNILPPYYQEVVIDPKDISKSLKKIGRDEVKIVFFGTPDISAQILEELIKFTEDSKNLEFIVQAVVTGPDQKVGRKQILTPSEVSQVAENHNIPILKPGKLDDEFITSNLPLLTSDLFIVVAYGKILPQSLLDIPKLGAINIHGSILPKYRGASPRQAAILNGDQETGVTLMLMDSKMDHGPVLFTKTFSLLEKDNYLTLSTKMSEASSAALKEFLPKFIKGEVNKKEQDHSKATFTKIIKKEDGFFEIDSPPTPEVLDRMIRAYYPWPTAWTIWKGGKGKGVIVKLLPEGMVQMEGKKPVKLKEFLNGYPEFPIRDLDK